MIIGIHHGIKMDYTSECLSLISFCGHFENRDKVINLICNKLEM